MAQGYSSNTLTSSSILVNDFSCSMYSSLLHDVNIFCISTLGTVLKEEWDGRLRLLSEEKTRQTSTVPNCQQQHISYSRNLKRCCLVLPAAPRLYWRGGERGSQLAQSIIMATWLSATWTLWQAFSLNVVRRVQQKMEKKKCCFCLARKQYDRNLCVPMRE